MKKQNHYTAEEIKNIGERVKFIRKLKNYSQNQLATKIEQHKDVIQRIESGNLKSVNMQVIESIARVLDCNYDYLLLLSNDSRNPHTPYVYQQLPEFAKKSEGFLFQHPQLDHDMEYIAQYMHPSYQNKIIELIHTLVLFHMASVHYPNTSPNEASAIDAQTLDKLRKADFFKHMEHWKQDMEKKKGG